MTERSYCATHPQVESYLHCSRCGKVICPRCMVYTPVGARCRQCAGLRRLPVFDAGTSDLGRGLGAGLAIGLLGGALISLPFLRFLSLFLILGVGWAVGRAVSVAANRRRATSLAAIAAATTVVGLLFGPLLFLIPQAPWLLSPGFLLQIVLATLMNPLELILIGVAALVAYYQVR